MKSVIITGKRVTKESPRKGREDHELWGVTRINHFYWNEKLTDWTRWFDLHPMKSTPHYPGIAKLRPITLDWYRRQDASRPIYLFQTYPDIPGSVVFPVEKVLERFPPGKFFYTCQVDYMIAFAILEGFEKIVLNGIGVRDDQRYLENHKGILFWVGVARGMGIDVEIDEPSVYIASPLLYGYEDSPRVRRVAQVPAHPATR